MAQLPVIIRCDRLDIFNALFGISGFYFTVYGQPLHMCGVTSITRRQKTETAPEVLVIAGLVRHQNSHHKYRDAELACSLEMHSGMLTVDVGDPLENANLDPLERLCLRCPQCGGESRPVLNEPKMYLGARIRQCPVCRDDDAASTWYARFTVPNLEGRPEHRLTRYGHE